jgi:pilus assembly protein CpaE
MGVGKIPRLITYHPSPITGSETTNMPTQPYMPLVAIVDTDEQDLMKTMQLLVAEGKAQVVGVAKRLDEIAHIMGAEPDIVLYDVGIDTSRMGDIISQIHDISPRCQVILTAQADTQVDLMRAMQVGARGLLRKPISADDLTNAIQEIFQSEVRRLQRLEEQTKAKVTQGRAGEVITVFSPKGGAGCTVISTHLALALAGPNTKVALADFDLQFGDVAVHLNLHSAHGVHELMRSIDDLDGSILDDVMVKHHSGVKVLMPPTTLDQVEDVETEGMLAVVKALRKYNDFVVIDMWHAIEEATLALMDQATVLLVVTTPEVPALRSTRRFLDYIRERPDLRTKVRLVVNRYPSKGAVDIKEIERSLGLKADGMIPSDGRLVTAAINEGTGFLTTRNPAAVSMRQLATTIAQARLAKMQRANPGAQMSGGTVARAEARG